MWDCWMAMNSSKVTVSSVGGSTSLALLTSFRQTSILESMQSLTLLTKFSRSWIPLWHLCRYPSMFIEVQVKTYIPGWIFFSKISTWGLSSG